MSRCTTLLIASLRGFWLSGGWAAREGRPGRAALLDRVAGLFLDGSLQAPRCGWTSVH